MTASTPKHVHKQLLYLFLVITLIVNIFLVIQKRPTLIYYRAYKDSVDCHLEKSDNLPSASNHSFASTKQIFFHETSCKRGLDSREACAIEAAAMLNPSWDINVLFMGPASKLFIESTVYENLILKPNIHFYKVDIVEFVKNTPVENLLPSEIIEMNKNWCLESLAGMMKYLALYKYGGVYLDLDVITVKSFDSLPSNWVAMQDSDLLGNAAFALARTGVGRSLLEDLIRDFSENFNPFTWDELSRYALSRTLKVFCNRSLNRKLKYANTVSNDSCPGITILEPTVFYPIHFNKRMNYFKTIATKFDDAYGHHLWSSLSGGYEASEDSVLAKIAQRSCPTTYELYKDSFGT